MVALLAYFGVVALHDRRTLAKVHPATLWGAGD